MAPCPGQPPRGAAKDRAPAFVKGQILDCLIKSSEGAGVRAPAAS